MESDYLQLKQVPDNARVAVKTVYKQEYPVEFLLQGILLKIWHRPTLPRVTAVPSALVGLTSLFGMGRGGHHRYRHLNIFKVIQGIISIDIDYSLYNNDILLKEVSLEEQTTVLCS